MKTKNIDEDSQRKVKTKDEDGGKERGQTGHFQLLGLLLFVTLDFFLVFFNS